MTAAVDNWLSTLERRAALRDTAGLRRELRPHGPADEVIDLAGNDYLGLARHPAVIAAASSALTEYGLGATGSRLVRGTTDAHATLEVELAQWLGTGFALVYSSGYLANLGAVKALCGPRTLLVSDAHNHASLVDGCRLAGAGRDQVRTVVTAHADVQAVRAELAQHPDRPAVVVTESIFSVDGDLAPLRALHSVCRERGALLLVDDAHAVGVIGPAGAGGVAAAGLSGEPDVVVTATLSKAFGAAGGVVAGPAALRTHLVDTGRTFIYDTALPPAVAGGAVAALRLMRQPGGDADADGDGHGDGDGDGHGHGDGDCDGHGDGDALRAELADRAAAAVRRLRAAGLQVVTPAGGVLSVTAASPEAAVAWAGACRARGVAVGCFRPPSTPDSRSRLRLTINVGVSRADFDTAIEVVVAARP